MTINYTLIGNKFGLNNVYYVHPAKIVFDFKKALHTCEGFFMTIIKKNQLDFAKI